MAQAKRILAVQGGGNTARLAAALERGAREAGRRVERANLLKTEARGCALLMTAADDNFWTFEQAAAYYRFALVEYIGFRDRGTLLAGGCGATDGKPGIDATGRLETAYRFGKNMYAEEAAQ